MNRKAQSAIEYLMTYGWMLLTVSIVSGVVYSSLGPSCVKSSSGFLGESINPEYFGLTNNDELAIALKNRRTDRIQVEQVVIDNSSTTVINQGLDPNSISPVTISGFTSTETCNSFNVEIVYSIESLDNRSVSGTITGPYRIINTP